MGVRYRLDYKEMCSPAMTSPSPQKIACLTRPEYVADSLTGDESALMLDERDLALELFNFRLVLITIGHNQRDLQSDIDGHLDSNTPDL